MRRKWRCDHQMAVKKGIRQVCDKRCNNCLCGIYTDEFGRTGHRADMRQGCPNVLARNLKYAGGRDRHHDALEELDG